MVVTADIIAADMAATGVARVVIRQAGTEGIRRADHADIRQVDTMGIQQGDHAATRQTVRTDIRRAGHGAPRVHPVGPGLQRQAIRLRDGHHSMVRIEPPHQPQRRTREQPARRRETQPRPRRARERTAPRLEIQPRQQRRPGIRQRA